MNQIIFNFFYNLTHQSAFFDKIIVFFAAYFIYIVIILAFLFLLFHHKIFLSQNPVKELMEKWREFFLVCVSGGLAWGLAKILKILIHTQRPFDIFPQVQSLFVETGYAFPSGHTAVASAVAFALFFTNKKVGYVFMFFALLIGFARIIAGVHFPIDILGGFILGALIAYFVKRSS
ncbi:MAG: Phosphoesterase PA-phosphatase related protein [Parcubacteria group bacterium GW2011_GWB1_37_13]|nr:MAG: Phosphoesterase PA-phosphatase related protein [Parcubacteria group bacterium GW2011_GWB1_37_13]